MTKTCLLMTRPEAAAKDFVAELERQLKQPVSVCYSPVVAIEPVLAELSLKDVTHLLFTSVNGVEQFCNISRETGIPALCVGDTTRAAALANGLRATAAQGKVRDLLRLALEAGNQPDCRFLYLRGEKISFDLVAELRARGVIVDEVVIYRQTRRRLTDQAIKALAGQRVVLPVFSANGAGIFLENIANTICYDLVPVCISPPVARVFNQAGLPDIRVSKTPDRQGMMDELRQLV